MLDENSAGVKAAVSNADDITAKLKTTADTLNSITGKIDTGQGTLGKLLNDDETHKNINDALKSVKDGVEQLSGTLGRINRLQLDIGFRTEYASRLHEEKYYFTLDAIPKEGKFYRLEIGALPHGKREDILESTTVTFPDGSKQWLLWIKDWDFSWQDRYQYKQPIPLPHLLPAAKPLAEIPWS